MHVMEKPLPERRTVSSRARGGCGLLTLGQAPSISEQITDGSFSSTGWGEPWWAGGFVCSTHEQPLTLVCFGW